MGVLVVFYVIAVFLLFGGGLAGCIIWAINQTVTGDVTSWKDNKCEIHNYILSSKAEQECTRRTSGSGSTARSYSTCKTVTYYRAIYNVSKTDVFNENNQKFFAAFDSKYGAWTNSMTPELLASGSTQSCLIHDGTSIDAKMASDAKVPQGDILVAVLGVTKKEVLAAIDRRNVALGFWIALWVLATIAVIAGIVISRSDWDASSCNCCSRSSRSYEREWPMTQSYASSSSQSPLYSPSFASTSPPAYVPPTNYVPPSWQPVATVNAPQTTTPTTPTPGAVMPVMTIDSSTTTMTPSVVVSMPVAPTPTSLSSEQSQPAMALNELMSNDSKTGN